MQAQEEKIAWKLARRKTRKRQKKNKNNEDRDNKIKGNVYILGISMVKKLNFYLLAIKVDINIL